MDKVAGGGQNWLATVTILTGDDLSMLFLSRGPTPCIPGGTLFTGGLLCHPGYWLIDFSLTGDHCIPIPSGAGIIGLPLCAQGASVDLTPLHFSMTNALDLVVG